MTLLSLVIGLVIALTFEAFFSGSEMALISVDKLFLNKQAAQGNKRAQIALDLLRHPEQMLVTTLLGTNLCIAFQAAIFTIFIYKNLGHEYEFYSVLILSPLVLIFGEILPKSIFQRYAESLSIHVALPLLFAKRVFKPMIWLLSIYTDTLAKRLGPIEELLTGKQPVTHREELRYLLTFGRREISLKSSEKKMIRKIFDFSKASVKNALIPLVNIDMVSTTTGLDKALKEFQKYGHSRLPVYNDRVDNIVGILHLFDAFAERDSKKTVDMLMTPAYYVPETQQLDELLFTMQKRGIQMAIVVDEYGGAIGIVTLEDIVEEIVGEIKDEYDSDTTPFKEVRENEYLIHAKMEIDAINEQLKMNLPHGSYETLAGFLLQQFNKIPESGDELYFKNLKFTIQKANRRAIELVHVMFIEEE